MRYRFSPVRGDQPIDYDIGKDVVTATIGNVTDTFDFSSMPDGKAEGIQSTLPINPVVSAERVEGMLSVELINYIGKAATEEERFPDWQVVD